MSNKAPGTGTGSSGKEKEKEKEKAASLPDLPPPPLGEIKIAGSVTPVPTAIKKRDLEFIVAVLQNAEFSGVTSKFNWPFTANVVALQSANDVLQKSNRAAPEFKAYEKLRIARIEMYAEKDPTTGQIKKQYVPGPGGRAVEQAVFEPEKLEAFQKDMAGINKEHQIAIDAEQKRQQEYEDDLDNTVMVPLYIIPFRSVPRFADSHQMRAMQSFIATPTMEELELDDEDRKTLKEKKVVQNPGMMQGPGPQINLS